MSVSEFEALAEEGKIGHVGLVESCVHLADLLGWALDRVDESLLPKRASRRLRTQYFDVPAGRVCGILHRAVGWMGKKERIVLDLQMYLGAREPRDEVKLRSHPPLHCIVPGGLHGDRTTASQLVSAAVRLPHMPPGLYLASELPAPRRPAGRVRHSMSRRVRTRKR
jgi:4-hydroxy-tetrahydrodipicolinate reductase